MQGGTYMFFFRVFGHRLSLLLLVILSLVPFVAAKADDVWSSTQSMPWGREFHTATMLSNGKVLVAGGGYIVGHEDQVLSSAEIYDPVTNTWSQIASMTSGHEGHTATLLNSGKVLVVGGHADGNGIASAETELYDPI